MISELNEREWLKLSAFWPKHYISDYTNFLNDQSKNKKSYHMHKLAKATKNNYTLNLTLGPQASNLKNCFQEGNYHESHMKLSVSMSSIDTNKRLPSYCYHLNFDTSPGKQKPDYIGTCNDI